jgi:hypothetical protein
MDKGTIINWILGAIPALWVMAGPAATVMVTGFFNTVVKAYVPREIQIPLAGLLSAAASSLAGSEIPIGTEIAIGSAIQGALSMSPNMFLSGSKTGK